MWQRRGPFLSLPLPSSPSIPRLHLFPPTLPTGVTRNHPSFAVAKFLPLLLPFTALPPCTPSTDVLFYFIIRPDLGELGCCLGVYTERPLSLSSRFLRLFPSHLLRERLASRLTEKLESRRRIREGLLPLLVGLLILFCLRRLVLLFLLHHHHHLLLLRLLEARLQLVCLGFGTSISRRREDPSRLSFYRSLCLPRPVLPVAEVARIKFMHG